MEAFKDIVMQKEVRPKNLEKAKSKDEKDKKKAAGVAIPLHMLADMLGSRSKLLLRQA